LKAIAPQKEASDLIKESGGDTFTLCFQCGMCTASCPWNSVKNYTPHRLITESRFGLADLEDEGWWLCTTCGLCVDRCPRGVGITDVIRSVRAVMLEYQYHTAPDSLRSAMGSLSADGNPWGGDRDKRSAWAEGLSVEGFSKENQLLYFPCCTPAYDPELAGLARASVSLLAQAGLGPAILETGEVCCGESALKAGNLSLFQRLADKNIQSFREAGVEHIVVNSPHCLNAFQNEYQRLGGPFKARHITEVLLELLDDQRLKPAKKLDENVVYHDPCYLGRYAGIYEEPRRVLEHIPGLRLIDEVDSRENSLCCGGGGGRIWMETKKGERFSDILVNEAVARGANILATSCPYCILNFRDSIRTMELEYKLRVMDVVELVWAAL